MTSWNWDMFWNGFAIGCVVSALMFIIYVAIDDIRERRHL